MSVNPNIPSKNSQSNFHISRKYITDISDIEEQGFKSFIPGEFIVNPYSNDTILRDAWARGYNKAYDNHYGESEVLFDCD